MTILDSVGSEVTHGHERRGVRSMKQIVFDWSGIVALIGGAMWLATLASTTSANKTEIERLRLRDEKQAETLATQTSVDRLADKVDALATEMRAAIAASRDRTTTNPR